MIIARSGGEGFHPHLIIPLFPPFRKEGLGIASATPRNDISVRGRGIYISIDCFAEFILSPLRFFASLRMTGSEGLAMTEEANSINNRFLIAAVP